MTIEEIEQEEEKQTVKSIFDLKIKDIDGIGPATVKKLKDVGIITVPDLAVCSASELSSRADITNIETSAKYIMAAQNLIKKTNLEDTSEFVVATKDSRKNVYRLKTGSTELDNLFKGGIESQAITEFYGEFGSSKSQICHTLCINTIKPVSDGGFDAGVLYIDTEGTFRRERLQEIAESLGYSEEQANEMIEKHVKYAVVVNSNDLENKIKVVGNYIKENNVKLIVVDSIIALHRAEYLGRGTLAERQQRIAEILFKLKRIAQVYNVPIVITNQVIQNPAQFFSGDTIKPVGGNILGHTSTYRVYLIKGSKGTRIATMVDSPYHPHLSCRFTINEKGVTDIEDNKKEKEKEK